jgi:hypothetical protein
MIGSPIFGWVYDNKGPIKSVWLLLVVSIIVLLATIIFNEIHEFTIFAYVISFGWGVMDAFLNNFLNISLGFEFKSKITPFSAQKCMSNLVIFALIMCESTIKTKPQFRIYFIAGLMYSIFTGIAMLKFPFKIL